VSWKLTQKAEGLEPLPGVPWKDLSDEEFQQASEFYGAISGLGPDALERSGYWEREKPARKADSNEEKEG
jgi:hypothetical protein